MKSGGIGYLSVTGMKNVWANKFMSLASIVVLSACLMITGIAMLFAMNVNEMIAYIEDQNEIIIYIEDDITQEQQTALVNKITGDENVASYNFVSKEMAMAEVQNSSDNPELFEDFKENPFPASYRLQMADINKMNETAAPYETMEGVEKLRVPSTTVDTVLTFRNIVSAVCIGFIGLFVLVSLVIISNTIRLTVFARRREINIMKYVGATNGFIRLPFVVEGLTIGAIAALISFVVVYFGYDFIFGKVSETTSTFINNTVSNFIPFSQLWYLVLGGFVLTGVFTGVIGSVLSMRKHLKV